MLLRPLAGARFLFLPLFGLLRIAAGACLRFLRRSRLALLESEPFPAEASSGAQPGTVVALDKSRGIMVQTGEGLLALRRLQLQTKKALPWRDFANGVRDLPGSILGKAPAQESRTQA